LTNRISNIALQTNTDKESITALITFIQGTKQDLEKSATQHEAKPRAHQETLTKTIKEQKKEWDLKKEQANNAHTAAMQKIIQDPSEEMQKFIAQRNVANKNHTVDQIFLHYLIISTLFHPFYSLSSVLLSTW